MRSTGVRTSSAPRLYIETFREWLGGGNVVWLSVTGDSMQPFLPARSNVLVAAVAPDRVRAGAIVLYENAERMVCHRVLTTQRRGDGHTFLTKGDSPPTHVDWIAGSQLIGTVVALEQRGVVTRLDTPFRRAQAIGIAVRSLLRAVTRWGRQRLAGRPRWTAPA